MNDQHLNYSQGGAPESIYEASPHHLPGTVPVSYPQPAHSPPPPSYTSRPPNDRPEHRDNPSTSPAPGQFYTPSSSQPNPANPTNPSPFDTVFDDHVYPVTQPSSSATTNMGQDTGYRGAAAGYSNYSNDNIPLQDTRPAPQPYQSGDDHVHDAEPGFPGRPASKPSRVHFGELGMWGANKKRIPFVVYLLTAIQIGVFVGELVKNNKLTGSLIMTKPSFNPMIGPSTYVLVNFGARFVPCMHDIPTSEIPKNVPWSCPNSTSSDPTDPNNQCTLGELCGFGAPQSNDNPDQWFRFVIPIFMHAGLVHIGFNMLLQLTIGREMEKAIGSIRFFVVYICAGIFGFVMGGNYGGTGFASVGASGSLFGIIALTLLDLFYSWRERKSPVRELVTITIEMVITFALGLLPGLDNFAHIGGFLMGLLLGICVLHSPNALRMRLGDDTPYTAVADPHSGPPGFLGNPVGFFKGRKPLWWAWWLIRAGALILAIVAFALLLQNFYVNRSTCDWCKYLSCIPVSNWCESQNLVVTSDDGTSAKRDLASLTLRRLGIPGM